MCACVRMWDAFDLNKLINYPEGLRTVGPKLKGAPALMSEQAEVKALLRRLGDYIVSLNLIRDIHAYVFPDTPCPEFNSRPEWIDYLCSMCGVRTPELARLCLALRDTAGPVVQHLARFTDLGSIPPPRTKVSRAFVDWCRGKEGKKCTVQLIKHELTGPGESSEVCKTTEVPIDEAFISKYEYLLCERGTQCAIFTLEDKVLSCTDTRLVIQWDECAQRYEHRETYVMPGRYIFICDGVGRG